MYRNIDIDLLCFSPRISSQRCQQLHLQGLCLFGDILKNRPNYVQSCSLKKGQNMSGFWGLINIFDGHFFNLFLIGLFLFTHDHFISSTQFIYQLFLWVKVTFKFLLNNILEHIVYVTGLPVRQRDGWIKHLILWLTVCTVSSQGLWCDEVWETAWDHIAV